MSMTECEGKILVHCHAGCSQAEVMAALRALGLWPERVRPEWTPAERAAWAKQQREIERDLPSAQYWRRAAARLTEEVLDGLKAALFDPTLPSPAVNEIYHTERLLARLRHLEGRELVDEYTWRAKDQPHTTAYLVGWAKKQECVERAALLEFLGVPEPAA
jgi:hypothetical protein